MLTLSSRSTVLVVYAGDAEYRGYCLEQVAAGYNVVLLTDSDPTWEKPHIKDFEVADLTDQQAILSAGRALAGRHVLAGVVTWSEWHLASTATLALHLGLLTNGPDVVRACRDKAVARALFARSDVPSATSIPARSLQEVELAAESIGYPVVLKPTAQGGSIGVIRINCAEDLSAGFEFAAAGAGQGVENPQVLVEEYLDGPEVSVECVTYHGRTTAVAVTRKSVGFAPYFEEIAHSVDAADPLLATVALPAAAAVEALGITDGIQHVEMRLVDGHPRLVEVNARIAGDLIGHLVHLATGIELARAAADLACGRAPSLIPTRSQAAAIRMFYPESSGVLTDRYVSEELAMEPEWLAWLHWSHDIGDEVLLPPTGDLYTARIGFLIATAPTGHLAQRRAEEAFQQIGMAVRDTEGCRRGSYLPGATSS
ncbi:ATP-grasp domain-containing protein [Streptomyces drozdowiczii]